MKIVILAGGGGTRLWPMSRKNLPKQFTKIIGDKILLRETIDRFRDDFSPDDIYISITEELLPLLKKELPDFPDKNIIVEPEKRDTGPAMGYVAVTLSLIAPDEPMVFVPSDHYVGNVRKYLNCFKVGEELIRREGKMMDIAIPANFPSTVLGYTQIGDKYLEKNNVEVYQFKSHTEKPNFETAKKYLTDGNYLWHGNYYMWTPARFLSAYQKYTPEIYAGLARIREALMKNDFSAVKTEYVTLPKISIDYAITEKMNPDEVLIIKGDFGWSDIGAWDVLADQLAGAVDENKNLVKGDWVGIDTNDALIYGQEGKIIVTIGVDNLVIVDTPDALLVCPKGRSQDVKRIVSELEEKNKNSFL